MYLSAKLAAVSALSFLSPFAAAMTTTSPPLTTITAAPTATFTAVSDCHAHGTVQFCVAGTAEYEVAGPTKTEEMESRYTGCHNHGVETFCMKSNGEEVEIVVTPEKGGQHEHEHEQGETNSEGKSCHFHAGVEHCVGGAEAEHTCTRSDRDYNKPLRIGLLFVILATSAIGVFSPIILTKFTRMSQKSVVFAALKQFGTGVILSTAFIHLFTHASLMFTNECLGELGYEGTTAAVFLAGLFLSFLVDYMGARIVLGRQNRKGTSSDTETPPIPQETDSKTAVLAGSPSGNHVDHLHLHGSTEDRINVLVLEAGIIFHSLLIGITLVVAGDSFFKILFVVILFHQMFEGLALGTCIAGLPSTSTSFLTKLLMGSGFTLVTPVGMAIGIGVLDKFNGNDPSTLIAIGTLDALSAGILAWVGIVEMLARDWMHGGLLNAGVVRSAIAMAALVSGMIIMSVLGKWA
ncbi:Zip-domain-containing protein [Byssothecium circinans]|uniref:Zip-domain-containing protein n=1 Tax=Byssothecium circinans TaxID=147558 RepID=A0A6A5TNE1_9PLEO|nr:Zip-domain-containing protein [Byssothecium circinans]